MDTIPKLVGKECERYVRDKEAQGERVSWRRVRDYAQRYAGSLQRKPGEHRETEAEEIVIHVGQGRDKGPAKEVKRGRQRPGETQETQQHQKQHFSRDQRLRPVQRSNHIGLNNEPVRNERRLARGDCDLGMRSEKALECYYCGRLGHVSRVCRRRLGVCFGCGSSGHMVRQCAAGHKYGRRADRTQSLPRRDLMSRENGRFTQGQTPRGPSRSRSQDLMHHNRTRPLNGAALP